VEATPIRKVKFMEIIGVLGFLALWFVLQLWVLPRLGVPT
jgi:hypothetical protein